MNQFVDTKQPDVGGFRSWFWAVNKTTLCALVFAVGDRLPSAAIYALSGLKNVRCVAGLFVLAYNLMRMTKLAPQLIGWGTVTSKMLARAALKRINIFNAA